MPVAIDSKNIILTTIKELIPSKNSNKEIVHIVATQALKELIIALAVITICFPFTAGGSILFLTLVPMASVGINAIVQFLFLRYSKCPVNHLISHAIRSCNFSLCNIANARVLVHEFGHFIAAQCLLKGNISIKLDPIASKGLTTYDCQTMTSCGESLGRDKCNFLISLAGPLLAILAATAALIAGLSLRHTHPEISSHLIGGSIITFLEHAIYAISAYFASPTNLTHDFVYLSTFGLAPIIAFIVILAIPTIILLGCLYINRHPHHKEIKASS